MSAIGGFKSRTPVYTGILEITGIPVISWDPGQGRLHFVCVGVGCIKLPKMDPLASLLNSPPI